MTIFEVAERNMRLAIYCESCGRLRYLKASYPQSSRLADLSRGMRCTRCRSDEVEVRPIARDARTGFWPAEAG